MAAQAALIADTVAGMKRAISGRQYSPESDTSFHRPTNRGNKRKRKAQYVQEGQLDLSNGPKVYKTKIAHAGYQRYIISQNPKRYDEDGDELDIDDVDKQADTDAAARNPYHDIRLEELLAPLTSAANLPNHPSLSIPYLSTPLSDMVRQACQMLHRERRTLWNIKHLLTKLRGDETWIPCGKLNSNIDHVIFNTDSIYEEALKVELSSNDNDATDAASGNRKASSRARINRSPSVEDDARLISVKSCEIQTKPIENSHQLKGNDAASDLSRFTELASEPLLYPDKAEIGVLTYTPLEDRVGAIRMTEKPQSTGSTMTNYKIESGLSEVDKVLEGRDPLGENSQACLEKKDDSNTDQLPSSIQTAQTALACQVFQNPVYDENVEGAGNVDHASQPMPHRMQTRARAQAATENPASSRTRSITPNSSIVPTVHPLYLMPSSASPDRNFGLPPGEAEETRRMVILYAQKQEEICRGAEKLYAGLLKADRMRKTVFQWCKAEGHVGQMSDGEDWYDKEEWGLEEDLRKGHDDEEDEAVTQVKRTRGRRS